MDTEERMRQHPRELIFIAGIDVSNDSVVQRLESQRLIQEITLKLLSECLGQLQTSTGCYIRCL